MPTKQELLVIIQFELRSMKMTQQRISDLIGISQARISQLMNGSIMLFSYHMLLTIVQKLGYTVKITINKEDKDE